MARDDWKGWPVIAALPSLLNHRSSRSRIPVGSIVLLAVLASPLSGQDTLRISGDDLACPGCVISLDTVLTLGGMDGPGLGAIDMASRIAVDRLGRILVSVYRQPEIAVFDSVGTFIRTVGGAGEGPGEYQFLSHVNVGFQHIHVFDMRGRTVLDHNFEVVRVDRFPAQRTGSHVLESEYVAFAGVVPTRASAGHPLHLLSPAGEMESFGGRGAVYGVPDWDLWTVTGSTHSLWIVDDPSVNRLTHWQLSGPRSWQVFERLVSEFDRHDRGEEQAALVIDAMLDDRGLWVVWRTPELYWLDLIDPSDGGTVARYKGDGNPLGLFANKYDSRSSYLMQYHESDAGIPFLYLVEINLDPAGSVR